MKRAHFYAYGLIGENDPLFRVFTGEDDPIISSKKVSDFLNENQDADEIVVHINSRGGSVNEGFAIHDLLTTSGKKITTRVEGLAASIASVVALSGSTRQITENSSVMIHNPWIDLTLIGGLEADDLSAMAEEMKREENRIIDFYVSKTGVDRQSIADFMKEETTFDAATSTELKFTTEILSSIKAFAFLNFKSKKQMTQKPKTFLEKVRDLISGETEVVEAPVETPAVETPAETTPTELETLRARNAELEAELSTLKAEREAEQEGVLNEITKLKEDVVNLKKNIKSSFQVPTGQTNLRADEGAPVNRVKEAQEKRKAMQKK